MDKALFPVFNSTNFTCSFGRDWKDGSLSREGFSKHPFLSYTLIAHYIRSLAKFEFDIMKIEVYKTQTQGHASDTQVMKNFD